jgi:hypothetical protein
MKIEIIEEPMRRMFTQGWVAEILLPTGMQP